jgi:plasmid maintenance system killer protein
MDGGFRHQGLEEIYRSGRTRRARRRSYREVQRILQLLDVAGKPEDKSVAGFRFHGLEEQAETPVGARDRELPDQFPLVARKRLGCRFGRLP